ncbi:hypothetical protein V6N12_060067 [Hibiscus sabdariffa]|uniref:Uncharacterized protein n=1 Tax=Hibiscus sabdariffa TaxID=183260 RepID=A0ABR2D652_9ROSI
MMLGLGKKRTPSNGINLSNTAYTAIMYCLHILHNEGSQNALLGKRIALLRSDRAEFESMLFAGKLEVTTDEDEHAAGDLSGGIRFRRLKRTISSEIHKQKRGDVRAKI